jgi:hypothetical protein
MTAPTQQPLICKCGKPVDEFGDHGDDSQCIYVGCDEEDCRALKNPNRDDLREVLAAMDHWWCHRYQYGCSHAC